MTISFERAYYEKPELWAPERYQGLQVERARLGIQWLPTDVASVLDVGCGNGVLTNLLHNRSCVVGVDRSLAALRWLQVPPCQADVVALPFQDNVFDAVISTEVIEHLPVQVFTQALAEMVRVARRYLLVTVPYCENLDNSRANCPACGCRFHFNYHMRRFDALDMERLFSRWDCVELTRVEGIFPITSLAYPQVWNGLRAIRRTRRRAEFPASAICPQCGYSQAETTNGKMEQKQQPRNIVGSLAYTSWPKTTTYRWWMALYTKRGN